MDYVVLTGLLAAAVRLAMSIGIAAMGEAISQRAGVLNVGVEGIMLLGAFLGAFGAVTTGNPWAGIALAAAGGAAAGALHGFFAVKLKVDQIVSGIALIILCLGLSSFLYRLTLGRTPQSVPALRGLHLGVLTDLPIVGPVLFGQNALVYWGVAMAIFLAWALRRTVIGLNIRACGENPAGADAAGIQVDRYRFFCVVFGGTLAGVGGAYLSVAQINSFVENMVVGRGFIAIACVVFGRWNPLGALAAAFGFGLAEAAQIRLQTWYPEVPYQFFVVLPYLLAIVALSLFFARGAALPRGLAKPYFSDRDA